MKTGISASELQARDTTSARTQWLCSHCPPLLCFEHCEVPRPLWSSRSSDLGITEWHKSRENFTSCCNKCCGHGKGSPSHCLLQHELRQVDLQHLTITMKVFFSSTSTGNSTAPPGIGEYAAATTVAGKCGTSQDQIALIQLQISYQGEIMLPAGRCPAAQVWVCEHLMTERCKTAPCYLHVNSILMYITNTPNTNLFCRITKRLSTSAIWMAGDQLFGHGFAYNGLQQIVKFLR